LPDCWKQFDQTSFMHEDVGLLTMSGQNRIFLFLSCLLLVCCTGASTAKADCADLVKQFNAAFSSRSLADVQALGTKIATDGGCDDLVIAKTQRARATLQFDQAKVLIKRGAPPSEYDALLADASKVLWDAAVQIGNDKSTQRQFVEATIAYERALELIKNEKLTPNQAAPDKKMIKAIFDSAAESRRPARRRRRARTAPRRCRRSSTARRSKGRERILAVRLTLAQCCQ